MGETLFELSAGLTQLMELMGSDDPDEQQLFEDTLEGLKGEIGIKIDSWNFAMQRKAADAKKLKELGDALIAKSKREENDLKRMKEVIFEVVDQVPPDAKGRKYIQGEAFKASIVNNGGKPPLEITGDVPKEYQKVEVVTSNDTEKIRKALDAGEELGFAHYGEKGRHLSIR